MARAVKAAEVAGHEPTINDGFRREFRLIQVTRHHGLAANSNFADAVGDGDPEIVEKLERLRLGKCTADNNSVELSAKRFMDLLEQAAADSEAWPAFRQRLVDSNECVE